MSARISTELNPVGGDTAAAKVPSKRGRYALHACNECKRRKVKCNGNQPCQRCTTQPSKCSYLRRVPPGTQRANGGRTRQTPMGSASTQRLSTDPSLQQAPSESSAFHSTHSDFGLGVIKDGLKAAGFGSVPAEGPNATTYPSSTISDDAPAPESQHYSPLVRTLLNDDLVSLDQQQAVRLTHVFLNGPGAIYPFLDPVCLLSDTKKWYAAIDTLRKGNLVDKVAAQTIISHDPMIQRLVLAIALVVDGKDADPLAKRLFNSAQNETFICHSHPPSIQSAIYFVLAALYHIELDQELQAGRLVWMAARACVELGLDQGQNVLRRLRQDLNQAQAMTLFACVLILDRRCSAAAGIQYILDDFEPEHALFEPTSISSTNENTNRIDPEPSRVDSSRQYMMVTVNSVRFASRATRIVNRLRAEGIRFPREEVEYLDYQVQSWQRDWPTNLHFDINCLRTISTGVLADKVQLFRRIVLCFRAYLLRIIMYRPVLYFPSRISANLRHASVAIDLANQCISLLWAVNESTTLLRSYPVFFKYYLINALGIHLLVMAKAWNQLGHKINQEFWQGLELLKIMSAESPLIMHCWKSIRSLEALAQKVGVSGGDSIHQPKSPQVQGYDADWSFSGPRNCDDLSFSASEPPVVRNEFGNLLNSDMDFASEHFDLYFGDVFIGGVLGL